MRAHQRLVTAIGIVGYVWQQANGGSNRKPYSVLAELSAERAQIEEAILTLERLAVGRGHGGDDRRSG